MCIQKQTINQQEKMAASGKNEKKKMNPEISV
jgi:hypothetical protein